MSLAAFILANLEPILVEWEAFAKSLPPGTAMTRTALRDDAERMLRFIAADLEKDQTAGEEVAKSHGRGDQLPDGVDSAAHDHALQRLEEGFNIVEMVSEYRALRASVSRLWAEQVGASDQQASEMIRFNEAVDQVLAESVERFAEQVGHDRELFLAVLGHDLRNPLSAIKMGCALLGGSKTLTARDQGAAVTISRSAERMGEMLHDLLDFTRTRLGAPLPITVEPCDLRTVCDHIAEEMRTAHPDRTISVEGDRECAGGWDVSRVEQLVSNLVGNAVQHGYRDTPVRIILDGNEEKYITICVANRGRAIPETQRRSIFDPLTRGVESEGDPGASHGTNQGLGLYIAKEIATAHGGTIEVTSTELAGTAFIVKLPRSRI